MSAKVPYTCDHCGAQWVSPISAAMCCDEAAFNPDDDERGYN